MHDLTTAEGTLAYLASTTFASSSAVKLSGGNTNFLYRCQLETPFQGCKTVTVKHSKPYLVNENFFAGSRQIFEVGALQRVHKTIAANAIVTVPAVHMYDDLHHVIIMDDAGENTRTLKDIILAGSLSQKLAEDIGSACGAFLANLHEIGLVNNEALEWAAGNKLAREILAWATYGRLVETVDGSDKSIPELQDPCLPLPPDQLDLLKKVAHLRQEETMTNNETFIMGDFWPGNLLVSLSPDGQSLERIVVVDWEVCRAGMSGVDVGQFCGDLRVLLVHRTELKATVNTLMEHFVNTYDSTRPNRDQIWAEKAAVALGMHLAVWGPRIPYADSTKQNVRDMVSMGVDYITKYFRQPTNAKQYLSISQVE